MDKMIQEDLHNDINLQPQTYFKSLKKSWYSWNSTISSDYDDDRYAV